MDFVSTNPSYTFKINRNRKLTAVFTSNIPVYTITATIDPAGAGTVTGAGQYQEGATATITATPAEGYTFSGWTENGATISTDESYTFTVTGNRAFVAGFAEFVPRLPDGYTELKYIESTGTQYISTGVKPTITTKVAMDVELTEAETSQTLFGYANYYTNQANGKRYYHYYDMYTKNDNFYVIIASGVTSVSGQIVGSNTIRRISLKFDPQNYVVYIDNVPISISAPTSLNSSYTMPIYLLCLNSKGTANGFAKAKLYSAQIHRGETIANDFVPCTNPSGAVGLYDLVSGSFYGNAGTGTFVAGPAV